MEQRCAVQGFPPYPPLTPELGGVKECDFHFGLGGPVDPPGDPPGVFPGG